MTDSALLLIDLQVGFDERSWGERNNPNCEANAARMLAAARASGVEVIHIRHHSREPQSPLRREKPGFGWKPETAPRGGERRFVKRVNSAFIGTGLAAVLDAAGITELAIVGLTTDHCVSTTARMAENLGYVVTVIADATATFERVSPWGDRVSAEALHDGALTSLAGEFATVIETDAWLEAV
mgnify:FL=1